MGGYGSLLLGLRKPEQYAAAASLSGVCDATQVSERVDNNEDLLFGGEQVKGTHYDLYHLASTLAASDRPKPKLYQCCGTEDFLYDQNTAFRDFMKKQPFDYTYEEGPGDHEWGYWDTMIQTVLRWLPISPGRK